MRSKLVVAAGWFAASVKFADLCILLRRRAAVR
jgi:hypothetical protein